MTSQYPDIARGDKTYSGLYQKELTELMENMSTEEIAEMQEVQAEWEVDVLPLDVSLQ